MYRVVITFVVKYLTDINLLGKHEVGSREMWSLFAETGIYYVQSAEVKNWYFAWFSLTVLPIIKALGRYRLLYVYNMQPRGWSIFLTFW